jgi:FtsZ-interacting cell division protein YlmF
MGLTGLFAAMLVCGCSPDRFMVQGESGATVLSVDAHGVIQIAGPIATGVALESEDLAEHAGRGELLVRNGNGQNVARVEREDPMKSQRQEACRILGPCQIVSILCLVCLSCNVVPGGECETSAPMIVPPERVRELREYLSKIFTADTVSPETIKDVEFNDSKRYANLQTYCPSLVERSTVMVDFVNMRRPQAENDILVAYGKTVLVEPPSMERCSRIFRLFTPSAKRFVTDDRRLFEIAKYVIENALFAREGCPASLTTEVISYIGFIRCPEATLFIQSAIDMSFWDRLYADLDQDLRTEAEVLESYQRAAFTAILDLPADESIPLLENAYCKLSPSVYYYRDICRYLDEAWKRKKGEPRADNFHIRYDYSRSADATAIPVPDWLYGPGGNKIEHPFGESTSPGRPGKIVEPTSVSPERTRDLRERLSEFVTQNIVTPVSIDDIKSNDARRYANLETYCPSLVERSTIMVDFVNMRRPQIENDILVAFGKAALSATEDRKKCSGIFRLFSASAKRFVSDDRRLFEIAKYTIDSALFQRVRGYAGLESEIISYIGFIRVPEATVFLQSAIEASFWDKLYADLDQNVRPRPDVIENYRRAAFQAILDLPPDESLPLLEKLYHSVSPSVYYYQSICRYLDEAWKRKKGEPRFDDFRIRYDYSEPFNVTPHPYPDWLYGPGGSRIEYPFGKTPEGYVHRKIHVDF